MKIILSLLGAVFIAGCATNEKAAALNGMDGVRLENDGSGNVFVAGYKTKAIVQSPDKLLMCVSQAVVNRSVSISGTATTFGVTGRMYSTPTTQTHAGGETIRFVSEDKRSIVAEGAETFRGTGMLAMTQRNIRYTLSAKLIGNELQISFENLEQAQLDSGTLANSGYMKVAAWSAAKPEDSVAAIQRIDRKLRDCMN